MLADEEVFASNCKTHSCARISTYLATLSFYPSLKTTGRHLEKRAKERILRYVTGFRAKREYRVTIKCVIFVQAVARGHMCRRDFLRWKRNSKRPFSLRLQAGKCMSAVGVGQETRAIVLITDCSMRRQLHRFDSNPVSYSNRDRGPHGRRCADGAYWNEEFLVPGTTQDIQLFITVVRSDDVFLGQAHRSMRESDFLLRTSPETTKVELHLGDLVVSYFHIGFRYASKIIDSFPYLIFFLLSLWNFEVDPKQIGTKFTHQKEMRVLDGLVPAGVISMEISVPNSLYSICNALTGPHIDVMRQVVSGAPIETAQGRRGKWWGCVASGCLRLYRSHDESTPSQEFRLRRIDAMELKGGSTPGFVITLPDKRRWTFEVHSNAAARRWLYAIEQWKCPRGLPPLALAEVHLLSSFIASSSVRRRPVTKTTNLSTDKVVDTAALRIGAVRMWLAAIYDQNF